MRWRRRRRGGYSVAARQRARGDSLRAGGAAWSDKHPHPRLRHFFFFFLTHLKILPGSTTEYCQPQKHDQLKTNRQSITVCSIDPHFAFNTQDEHTEAPLTKVFLHMNSEGLVQQPVFCRPLHVDKSNNISHWKKKKKKKSNDLFQKIQSTLAKIPEI